MKRFVLLFLVLTLFLWTQAQQSFINFASKNTITTLAEDDTKIWIGTTGGLFICEKTGDTVLLAYTVDNGLPSNYINDIVIDYFGNVWVATLQGLAKFDGSDWTVYNTATGLPDNNIEGVAIDQNGNTWLYSRISLSRLQPGGTLTNYLFEEFSLGSNHNPECIIADSFGNIWLGTLGVGVYEFNVNNETFMIHTGHFGSSNTIYDIILDANDVIWFASYDGLASYDGNNWNLYTTEDGLASNMLNCLDTDDMGNIWVGTYQDGITKFDPTGSNTESYDKGNLSNEYVKAIIVDAEGKVWVGTYQGLNCYDIGLDIWTEYIVNNSLSDNFVTDVEVDAFSNVWVTTHYGLNCYDGSNWTNFFLPDSVASNQFLCVDIDANGDIWAGGYGCLLSLDLATDTFTTYNTEFSTKWVNDILCNSDGTSWLATSEGLVLFDESTLASYTTSEGLIDDNCRALLEDALGNLWVGTDSGISVWNGTAFTNYTMDDGLSGNRIYSFFSDDNNDIYAVTDYDIYNTEVSVWNGSSWSQIGFFGTREIDKDIIGNYWSVGSYGAKKYNDTDTIHYTHADGMASNHVNCITIDPSGVKWLGMSTTGLTKVVCQAPIPDFINDTACLPGQTHFTNISSPLDVFTSYEWDINNDESVEYTTFSTTHQFQEEGTYSVKLTAYNESCSGSVVKDVVTYNTPFVQTNPSGNVQICEGTSVDISVSDVNGVLNPAYTIEWFNGDTDSSVNVSEPGTYNVTVTNNICTYSPAPVTVNIVEPIEVPICMVTVDTSLSEAKNLIVFEKPVTETIASFNIYKEYNASNYELVASQDYENAGEFIDDASQPSLHPDRYKISTVDICGNESVLSPYHRTIKLTLSQASEEDAIVLSWNKYQDEGGSYIPTAYNIYRGLTPDNMTLEDVLTGDLSVYVYNVSGVVDNEKFIVSVDFPNCTPSNNSSYHCSVSNIEEEDVIISNTSFSKDLMVRVCPNPAKDKVRIQSDNKIERVRLLDISGKVLFDQDINTEKDLVLDLSTFVKGLYFIEVNARKEKLIIE